jgi:hypothetical protein
VSPVLAAFLYLARSSSGRGRGGPLLLPLLLSGPPWGLGLGAARGAAASPSTWVGFHSYLRAAAVVCCAVHIVLGL